LKILSSSANGDTERIPSTPGAGDAASGVASYKSADVSDPQSWIPLVSKPPGPGSRGPPNDVPPSAPHADVSPVVENQ